MQHFSKIDLLCGRSIASLAFNAMVSRHIRSFWPTTTTIRYLCSDSSKPRPLVLAHMVESAYHKNAQISCRKWERGSCHSYSGFRCLPFINHHTKELVVVHVGTENLIQLQTDVLLAFNICTGERRKKMIKIADTQTWKILEENQEFINQGYSITLAGHSLGGWIATICLILIKFPMFNPLGPREGYMIKSTDIHCVSFDSPGVGPILDRLEYDTREAVHLSGLNMGIHDAIETLDITGYLSNPNIVNFWGRHVGKVIRLNMLSKASWRD